MEQEKDLTQFDKSLTDFLQLCKTVIHCNEKRKLKLHSRENPILSHLEKYIRIYDRTDPEEHIWYFDKIYRENRSAILRGPRRDNWIASGKINVHFGEEIRKPIKDAIVHLTIIYNTSCKLRDDVEESIQGLPDVDQSKELIFPTLFMLFLYKIFSEICDSEDTEKLSDFMVDLGKQAGVKSNTKKSGKDDPLGGILNVATDLMQQMGIELPEGQNLPSTEEFSSAISGIMNNPQTKNMLGNIMSEMKECNNIGDVFGKLMNGLGNSGMDPAMQQTIQDNIGKASETFDDGSGDEDEFVN